MREIEFFYDCSSPWTWLAFEGVQRVAAEAGARIVWRPFLVGAVFNAVNESVYRNRENPDAPKMRYMRKDLADWARHEGLDIRFPPSVFPVNSARAMRACFFAEDAGALVAWSRAVFEGYWRDDRDISQPDVLEAIAAEVGLDAPALMAASNGAEAKARLRTNGDELIARGGFGSPTMFVNGDDMYFGNDRLGLVAEALRR